MQPTPKTVFNSFSDYTTLFNEEPKPFAFVDKAAFLENLKQLKLRCGDKSIRVATKSIRCVSLLKWIQQFGDIHKLMCFTADEAVMLAEKGFSDLLVAYPTIQRQAIQAVCDAIQKGTTIYLTVDSLHQIKQIEQIAKANNITIPLSVDVDVSMDFGGIHFGVYRSTIKHLEQLKEVITAINNSKHVELKGIMTYDAQLAGVADDRKGNWQNPIIKWLKSKSVHYIQEKRSDLANILTTSNLDFINGGGTGSLELAAKSEVITELTFGSGLFQPHLFDDYTNFSHIPAAGFAVEVCRNPQHEIFTALGGGYVASGSAGKDKLPVIVFPEQAKLIDQEGAGEVQTPFKCKSNYDYTKTPFAVLRHAKAGEYCERFNELLILEHGKIAHRFPTYRGEGFCFL